MIYHITTENAWQCAQESNHYSPESLKTEGFIHCSDHFQLEGTANRFYDQTPDLIVLEIDPDKLDSRLVYENLEGGKMLFPHIYGTLNLDAVVATFHFERADSGRLVLPDGRKHPEPELITEFPFHMAGKVFRSPTPGSRMFDPENKVLGLFKEKGSIPLLCSMMKTNTCATRGVFSLSATARLDTGSFTRPFPIFLPPNPDTGMTPLRKPSRRSKMARMLSSTATPASDAPASLSP